MSVYCFSAIGESITAGEFFQNHEKYHLAGSFLIFSQLGCETAPRVEAPVRPEYLWIELWIPRYVCEGDYCISYYFIDSTSVQKCEAGRRLDDIGFVADVQVAGMKVGPVVFYTSFFCTLKRFRNLGKAIRDMATIADISGWTAKLVGDREWSVADLSLVSLYQLLVAKDKATKTIRGRSQMKTRGHICRVCVDCCNEAVPLQGLLDIIAM